MKKSLCVLLGLLLFSALFARVTEAKAVQNHLRFTENRGQVRDDQGNARPDILYTASVSGATVYFRKDAVSYVFHEASNENKSASLRTDIVFRNANPQTRVLATHPQVGKHHYYLGETSVTGVQSFGKITYYNIYPNVDLTFFSQNNQLKYEFTVHAGGRVNDIQLHYVGFQSMEVGRDGSLSARHAFGNYGEEKPYTFQANASAQTEVSSAFRFKNGVLSFEVGDYDTSKDLVIDPLTRIWSGNIGGAKFDRAHSVAVGADNSITYTGFTASDVFPTTPGVAQTTFGGVNDVIVARYNPDNSLAWATYYGGSGLDQANAVAVDNAGNAVVVGVAQSTNFPTTLTVLPKDDGRTQDGFILRLKPDGTREWATLFGGTSTDDLRSVAISAVDGSIYTVGRAFSSGLATLGNTAPTGSRDAFLLKLTSAGARTWSAYYGGTNDDQAFGVALDASDNVYVSGHTNSTDLPMTGAFQATNGGGYDAFVAQYNSAGTRVWSTYYGGTATENANGITFNRSNNNVYIVGLTASTNFPITGGSAFGGNNLNDGFLIGFNATGTRNFARYLGGAGSDILYGVGTLGTKIYVAGSTTSTSVSPNDPLAVNLPFQSSNAGATDTYIMKIDASASNSSANDWSFMYGSTSDEVARALATNANGRIAIAGYTNSPDFPLFQSPNQNQAQPNVGNDDAYIISFSEDAPTEPCTPFTTTATKTDPSCDVAADGTITVQQPTQRSTVTYTLLGSDGTTVIIPSQTSNSFSGRSAGTYIVRANDSNGNCSDDSDPIILTAGPSIAVTTTNVNPGCVGQTNGSITVTAPVGNNYRYSITGSATEQVSPIFNSRAAGAYVITVRDVNNGCRGTSDPINLTDPAPITATVTNTTLPCQQTTGSLTVTASGGTGALQYEISAPVTAIRPKQASPTFAGLGVGQYTFKVTDSRGCEVSTSGSVLNNAIEVGSLGSPTTCGLENGSIDVTFVSGGTPPYRYRIIRDFDGRVYPFYKNGQPNQPGTFFQDLGAGIYIVEVIDAQGCIGSTINSDVKDNPNTLSLIGTLFNTTNCRTGATSVTVVATTANPPLSYSIDGGAFQLSNVFNGALPGAHIIQVRDNSGCALDPINFFVDFPSPLRLNIAEVVQPSCLFGIPNGAVRVVPTSFDESLQYFIADSALTTVNGPFAPQTIVDNFDIIFADLVPGTYKAIGRLSNGCADTILFRIKDANGINIGNFVTQSPTCGGRSDAQLTLDITGGTAPIKYVLYKNGAPADSVTKIAGDVTLREAVFANLTSGNYRVLITDANSCSAERSATISEPKPLKINSFQLTPVSICGVQDGSVRINATGGSGEYLYTLNGTNTSINALIDNIPSGYYDVRVEDAQVLPDGVERCKVDSFFILNDPGSPNIINVQAINAACSNDPERTNTGQIVVSVSSAVRPLYFYSQGFSSTPAIVNSTTHTFRNLGPGTYNIVVATDAFPTGCAAYYQPITITAPAPIVITSVNILSQPACGNGNTGGTLQVVAQGGSGNYSYSIDNGLTFQSSPIFTNVYPNAGGYTAVVRDLNGGCTVSGGTYFLANPSGLELAEPPILTYPTCGSSNGSIKVIPRGRSSIRYYSLNGGTETASTAGSFTFSNLGSGTYVVRVRDDQGCKAVAIVNFSEIAIGDLQTTKPTCGNNDGSFTIRMAGGSNNYKYKVTGFAFDGTNVIAGLASITPITGLATGQFTINNLGPGTYDVMITDSLGSCSITQKVNLSSQGNNTSIITNVLVQNRTCNAGTGNGEGGAISIFATNSADRFYMVGPGNQTFNAQNVAPLESETFSSTTPGQNGQNLTAGTYQIFVSKGSCVTVGDLATITEPELIRINDVVVTQPMCVGGSSTLGTIKVLATGGRSLQYSMDGTNWQSGNTFSNLSPDPAGINIFVREAGTQNCQLQWPFQVLITNPSGLSIRTTTVQNPQCNSTNTGFITVRVTSGVAPYKMYIGGNEDGTLATAGLYTYDGLSAGTYTIVVTDANNCADRLTVTLANPNNVAILSAGLTVTQPGACIGGAINLDFSGVTPPGSYEYQLYDGALQQLGTPFNNLTSGVYLLRVRDVNNPNCTKDTLIYLNSTSSVPLLSMDGVTKNNISCFGAQDGSITIFASTPANTAGTVFATITGVTPNTTTSPNPITKSAQSGQPITYSNLGPGVYDIVIANADEANPLPPNYCVSALGSYRIQITQPQRLIINEVRTTDQNCAAGTLGQIEISAFGGSGELQYSIDGGTTWQNSNLFTNLQPSNLFADGIIIPETYRIVVRDKHAPACSVAYTGVARIQNRSQMFFVFDQEADVVNVTCPGQTNGSIRFNVNVNVNARPTPFPVRYYLNGTLIFTASNASLLTYVKRNLGEGTYELKAIDNTGCEVIQTATVGVFPPIESSATVTQQPRTCGATNPAEMGSAKVTVRGGQTENIEYKLVRNGDTLVSGVVSITDPNEFFWTIEAPDIFTRNFTDLEPGYYQFVTRIRGANCWTKDTFVLRDPGTPLIRTVNTTIATNQVCSNGQADIIIFGGGINIKYEILDEFGRTVFRSAQSNSKFALPAGKYVARVRTGLGVNINNDTIPFCYSSYGPFEVGCTFSRDEVALQTASDLSLSIYPNPNKGNFNLNIQANQAETVKLEVLDMTGRTVWSQNQNLNQGENAIPVELTGVASGLYLIRCGQQTAKLIVE